MLETPKAKKIIESFGGKALVRGGKYIAFEGEDFIRTVIWEFKNIDIEGEPEWRDRLTIRGAVKLNLRVS